jgi:Mrp family chromosome partitioning ATPase
VSQPDPNGYPKRTSGWTNWPEARTEPTNIQRLGDCSTTPSESDSPRSQARRYRSLLKRSEPQAEGTPDEARKVPPTMIDENVRTATPTESRGRNITQLRWAAVGTEVLQSCSVALRRMGGGQVGSIAVTSTSRREGRTTVAIGLTAAAAFEHGRRTILVDLDVERCSVESRIQVHPGPGLLDALDGRAPLGACVERVDDRVQVLRAGPPSNPGALVARIDRLAELLDNLKEAGDLIIADLPPLDSGIATAHLTDVFESVLLVVRAGGLDLPQIEHRASVLSQQPYVLLNGMDHSRSIAGRIRRARR